MHCGWNYFLPLHCFHLTTKCFGGLQEWLEGRTDFDLMGELHDHISSEMDVQKKANPSESMSIINAKNILLKEKRRMLLHVPEIHQWSCNKDPT